MILTDKTIRAIKTAVLGPFTSQPPADLHWDHHTQPYTRNALTTLVPEDLKTLVCYSPPDVRNDLQAELMRTACNMIALDLTMQRYPDGAPDVYGAALAAEATISQTIFEYAQQARPRTARALGSQ